MSQNEHEKQRRLEDDRVTASLFALGILATAAIHLGILSMPPYNIFDIATLVGMDVAGILSIYLYLVKK